MKTVELQKIERLEKDHSLKTTRNDNQVKTLIGFVNNKSIRISIVYYLNTVVFTDLITGQQVIKTLTH